MSAFPYQIGADAFAAVVLPASLEERYELLEAYTIAETHAERCRILAASLALCWPLLRDHCRVNAGANYTGNVLVYGRQVLDALLSNSDPADRGTVLAAGRAALEAVDAAMRPVTEAIRDAEVPPPPGGSGGSAGPSSPSSASTISAPAPSEISIPS